MINQMYEDYCSNRLPCGICRLTNSQCPKCVETTITCKLGDITTEVHLS